jgi:hypothetical protein
MKHCFAIGGLAATYIINMFNAVDISAATYGLSLAWTAEAKCKPVVRK